MLLKLIFIILPETSSGLHLLQEPLLCPQDTWSGISVGHLDQDALDFLALLPISHKQGRTKRGIHFKP